MDALILAGDISHHLDIVEATLQLLSSKFKAVFYTPGNHDLWCTGEGSSAEDSLQKLQQLQEVCDRLGVHTGPQLFGSQPHTSLGGVTTAPYPSSANGTSAIDQLDTTVAVCDPSDLVTSSACWIVPLFSWYHLSFDSEPELDDKYPPVTRAMTDFRACKWPVSAFT